MTQIHADTPIFLYVTISIVASLLVPCIIIGLIVAAVWGNGDETK
jgi:hypothetical protein